MSDKQIETAYRIARERYAGWGVDTDAVLRKLAAIPVSMHCWQGDDVGGFENPDAALGGGLAVTGDYPGKARTPDELRADVEKAFSLVPGKHRLNLHASYVEFPAGWRVDRDAIEPEHFRSWIDWAKSLGIGMDFNPTCFAHPKAADGFTLSHRDEGVRRFWIDHCKACRRIGAAMGQALGSATVTNIWIPDGMKDTPADRRGPRERLKRALDEVFAESFDPRHNLDAVEGKLFGIGAESYTVGSHEFYLAYAVRNDKLVCLDAGHYHPTESLADKVSAILAFVGEILLHVSRGVRWDSDHVIALNDDLLSIAQELTRGGYLDRTHIGLDFFDASINRIAAWTIGMRNMIRALCIALLDPVEKLQALEAEGDYTARLALMEELKTMPFAAVWDRYCVLKDVPVGMNWMIEVKKHEDDVLSRRR
ncbi:MAG: L-rhamnose isomerase [Vicinamibacteria bacterium]|nr:L-rhamnose isomerase [Vicinamibacteria bacterium]